MLGLVQRFEFSEVYSNDDALWHGNIFLVKRKKILQLTHEATRFSIFIHGITKKDLASLNLSR